MNIFFSMETMKQLIKKFDYFGIEIHFLYQSQNKYYSTTGGLIFILFLVIALIYIGCNIPPLLFRSNMTVIFYDSKIDQTDQINFQNLTSQFSYGFICDGYKNKTYLDAIFRVEMKHISMKSDNGNRNKTTTLLNNTKCTKKHFFNEFNESFNNNNLDEYYCFEDNILPIGGTYADPLFTYYEVALSVIDESKLDEISYILQNYECKLETYNIDTAINVYDYQYPIKRYISSLFITIKSNMLTKMNIYFKFQSFQSYENYFFDKSSTQYHIGLSSTEVYEDDKGYDRFEKKPDNYKVFAKMYLRAALERTIIQRKYMKITEFAANMSSILSAILLVFYIFVRSFNIFFAEQSIIKRIFQFKDFYKNSKKEIVLNKMKDKFLIPLEKSTTEQNDQSKIDDISSEKNMKENKAISSNILVRKDSIFKIKKKTILQVKDSKSLQLLAKNSAHVKINLFEYIVIMAFPFCKWNNLKFKHKLFEKGFQKLCYQLDVITYLKKMQQIELMNYVVLNPNQNTMINFLAKPSISYSNEKDAYDYLQLKYNVDISDEEINEFFNYIKYLHEKKKKTKIEQRLYDLAVMQLTNLLFKNRPKHK